jgi:hypothetical protein
MTRPHRSPLALHAPLALLLACTPLPKSIGDDELDTDPTGADPTEGGTSDELGTGDWLWSHASPAGTFIVGIAGMPDDGVAVVEHRQEIQDQRVIRYAPDGSELWRVDLGSWSINAIDVLDDGRLLLGGSTRNDEGRLSAAVWRLSPAGVVEAMHQHATADDHHTRVMDLTTHGTTAAYLVSNFGIEPGMPATELFVVDLGLAPQWSWNGFSGDAADVAVVPSGEVLTLEPYSLANGTDLRRTFDVAGTPTTEEEVPGGRFADDEPLVMLEAGPDGVDRLVGLAGTVFDVLLAGDAELGPRVATHRHGVAAVGASHGMLALVQHDSAGNALRDLLVQRVLGGEATALDIAIASDGAVYIGGYELFDGEPDMPLYGFILKLPPPA